MRGGERPREERRNEKGDRGIDPDPRAGEGRANQSGSRDDTGTRRRAGRGPCVYIEREDAMR